MTDADAVAAGSPADGETIASLLRASADGDRYALDRLMPLVYEDLRRLAHRRLWHERDAHTLNTTALVHEAYLRLAADSNPAWNDRIHFMAVCSRIIRNLLIDYERRRQSARRGGGEILIPLRTDLVQDGGRMETVELIALDAALTDLSRMQPRLEQVVEYRFFGGLTVAETAEVLCVSVRTVERDWTRARAYLYRALAPAGAGNE